MKELIDYVAQKSNVAPPTAEAVAAITLDFLVPHCSPLLKNTIEVMLTNPELSEAQKDLLIATRILLPQISARYDAPST